MQSKKLNNVSTFNHNGTLMKVLWMFFLLIIAQISFAKIEPVQPKGYGTEDSPYLFERLENFFWLSKMAGRFTQGSVVYCKQTKDIDASATLNGGEDSWPAISSESFTLNYDGQNYIISKPFISSFSQQKIKCHEAFDESYNPKYYFDYFSGIFCYGTFQLENIIVEDITVQNSGSGLLVGYIYPESSSYKSSSSYVKNCKVKNGSGNIIGAVQFIDLYNAYVNICNVTLENIASEQDGKNLGGLIGSVSISRESVSSAPYKLFVSNCTVNVSYSGTNFEAVAGLIGKIESRCNYKISNCHSRFKLSVTLSSTNSVKAVGGLIGHFNCLDGQNSSRAKAYIDNSYAIHDITINSQECDAVGGLVGRAPYDYYYGTLNITNCYAFGNINISQKCKHIGGLVGSFGQELRAFDSRSSGTIEIYQGYYIGGIIGNLSGKGSMFNCHSKTSIKCSNYLHCAGGLEGGGNFSINNCFFIGNIESASGDNIGGLVGYGYGKENTIIDSYSKINLKVDETSGNIGGLVGAGNNNIIRCFSEGEITLKNHGDILYVGGVIGKFSGNSSTSINNSYSKIVLNIKSDEVCQGIGGFLGGTDYSSSFSIWHCYFSGKINVTDGIYIGAFGGEYGNYPNVTECYYNSTACNLYDEYAEAKTAAEMKKASTFINWDFVDIWDIEEGKDTPYLYNVPEPSSIAFSVLLFLCFAKKGMMN